LPARIKAIQEGHGYVKDNDVWPELRRNFKQRMPIGNGGDHFAGGLEKLAEGFDKNSMVIGKNHTWKFRSSTHSFPLDL
jgi:hypothetical protein